MQPSDYIVVSTTVDSGESAERIAAALIDARLAACVQISGPLESHYVWAARRERAREWLCTIKTRAALFPSLCETLTRAHPYDTPEIVATAMTGIGECYAAWIDAQTTAPAD